MKICKALFSVLLICVIFAGCTRKNNPLGTNWSNARPQKIETTLSNNTDSLHAYSFQRAMKITGSEIRLLIGNDGVRESRAIMRFSSLPDSIREFTTAPTLNLYQIKRFSTTEPLVLKFQKVTQRWTENQATWTHASTDTLWNTNAFTDMGIADFTDTLTIQDTLNIPLPTNYQNWKTAGVDGLNLLMYSTSINNVEFRSSESNPGPILKFKYKKPLPDETVYEYSRVALYDTFIVNDLTTTTTSGDLILRSISPNRIFIKFDVDSLAFRDSDNEILNSTDKKHVTINRAEIVLHVQDNPYFGTNSVMTVSTYRVKNAVADPRVLTDADVEFITYSLPSITVPHSDSIRVSVTPIIQGFTSGKKDNYGIVIRLSSENQDFSSIRFYGADAVDPNKRPRLSIIYTPPTF